MGEHELEELMLYMILMTPTIMFASFVMIIVYNISL
jgi:hypothetical protein